MAFRAKQLRMVLLPLALASVGQAQAVDTREVIIDRQVELAISPEHLGHVLASPNRDFTLPFVTQANSWWVFAKPSAKVAWVDKSYLQDPRNIEVKTVYFDFDVDVPLDPSAAMAQLSVVKALPVTYLLVGHADEVGSDAYNMQLSVRRANNMREVLVRAGIPASQIQTLGKGNRILASLRNQALNRRVEVIVRGDPKTKAEVKKALVIQAARARQGRMEQDALRRTQQVRPPQFPSGAAPVAPEAAPRPQANAPTRNVQPSATQRALLPPVRESQMNATNPFYDGKEQ